MRKWLTRCAVAAALIGTVLLAVLHQLQTPPNSVGRALPQGKVKPQLVSEEDTAVLLAPDGSLWAWGGTGDGLLGVFPQPEILEVPRRIGSDSDWSQVSAALQHTVALKCDGSLWAWGTNRFGEAGQGNLTKRNYATPTRIGSETNWTQICSGFNHNLALKNDGSAWAWGLNTDGVLGTGTTNDSPAPAMVGTNRDWRMIAAEDFANFALKSNGTLWEWGYCRSRNSNDLVPKPIGYDTNWAFISASGYAMVALKNDGTVWVGSGNASSASAWNSSFVMNMTQIGRDKDWTEVCTGDCSFFGRKKDGSWWGWGNNDWRQLGVGTNAEVAAPQRVRFNFEAWAFAPGVCNTLVLGKDGKLWTWGYRLGVKPSAARQRFEAFVAPAVKRFPSLGFLVKSDIDSPPHLLWELPPEVRRSLGTGPISLTNHLTSGHPAAASHE